MHKNAISGAVQASVATGAFPSQYSSDTTQHVRNNNNNNNHNNISVLPNSNSNSGGGGLPPAMNDHHQGFGIPLSISNQSHATNEMNLDNHNAAMTFGSSRSSPKRQTIPIVYQISSHVSSRAFSITVLLPKHRMTRMEVSPLVRESANHYPHNHHNNSSGGGTETHVLRLAVTQMLQLHHETESSSPNAPSWLDRTTLVTRLQKGGEAVGLSISQWRDVTAVVEETAARLTVGWCPEGTESIQVELVISEGIVTIAASVSNPTTSSSSSTRSSYHGNSHSNSSGNNNNNNNSGGGGSVSSSSLPLYRNPFPAPGSSPSSSSNQHNSAVTMSSPSLGRSLSAGPGSGGVWVEPQGELLATAKPFPAPGSAGGSSGNASFSNPLIGSSDILSSSHHLSTPTNNRNAPPNAANSRGFTRSYSMGSYNSSSSPSTPIGSIGSSHGGGNTLNPNTIFSSPRGEGSPYPNWFQQGADANSTNNTNTRNFLQPHSNQQNTFRPPPMMNPGPSPPQPHLVSNLHSSSRRSSPQDGGSGGAQQWNASPKSLSSYHGSSSPRNWSRQNSGGHDAPTINTFSDPLPMMSQPDPLQIVEPLRSMGFSQRQCDAAVQAILNVSMEDSPHATGPSIPVRSRFDSQSSFPSSSGDGGNDLRLGVQEGVYQMSGSREERSIHMDSSVIQNGAVPDQLSGEDILDFVLSSNKHEHSEKLLENETHNRNNTTNNDIVQMESTMRNLLARSDGSNENASSESKSNVWGMTSSTNLHDSSSQQDVQQAMSNAHPQPSVWGNAGKLKVVKSSSTPGGTYHDVNSVSEDSIPDSASIGGSSQWTQSGYLPQQQQQQQNLIKVLNIPPDLNAFVFHCNANTREECLQRGLFG